MHRQGKPVLGRLAQEGRLDVGPWYDLNEVTVRPVSVANDGTVKLKYRGHEVVTVELDR